MTCIINETCDLIQHKWKVLKDLQTLMSTVQQGPCHLLDDSLNRRSWSVASILKNKTISYLKPYEIGGGNKREIFLFNLEQEIIFSLNKVAKDNKKQKHRTTYNFLAEKQFLFTSIILTLSLWVTFL